MKALKQIIAVIGCCVGLTAAAQDVQFSQFYAAPMYLNPALTGSSDQHRATVNFRDQWPNFPGAFISYSASYDVNIAEANSGLGFYFTQDRAGSGALSTTSAGMMYAYDIKIDRRYGFRPALGIGFGNKSIDYTKLQFGDQLLTGNDLSFQSNLIGDSKTYVDISTGGVFYTNDLWVGASAFHLNRPNNSLIGQESILSPLYSVHAGYRLPVTRTVKREIVQSITLTANYKAQGKWDQFDIGGYYFHKPFVMGIWYRGIPGFKAYQPGYQNNDAVVLMAGIHTNYFKFGYSYDITISKIWANSGGAHEVSVIYEYVNPKKKRKSRRRKLACPSF